MSHYFKSINVFFVPFIILGLLSCNNELERVDILNQGTTKTSYSYSKSRNPYSLSVMQVALETLLATKTESVDPITLEPTDYYIRVNPLDTMAIKNLQEMDIEVFDYPLDIELEDDLEICHSPSSTEEAQSIWYYASVAPNLAVEEVPYELVLEAMNNNDTLRVELINDNNQVVPCELLDECFVPDHYIATKSGKNLPVSAEELESMAFKIAGITLNDSDTKASSVNPSGYIYFMNGSETVGLSGVKIRAQKWFTVETTHTGTNGSFSIGKKFKKPNISIIYSNRHGFSIWGNWAFICPATFTQASVNNASNFKKYFSRSSHYSAWSWSVVNNAAYDYYLDCSSGLLARVSKPPKNLKIWCFNMDIGFGGGAPMIKHLVTSRVLSGTTALATYLASLGWFCIVPIAVASLVNIMGPDILIKTKNESHDNLYATTWHELSHASHFSSIGEWNYGKMIWYEMTHGDTNHLYGVGGTGSDGEGWCELSEAYAFSIENYVLKRRLCYPSPLEGTSAYYFFNKYTRTLTGLLNGYIVDPGEVFCCMTKETSNMRSLLTLMCTKFQYKEGLIKKEMYNNGL